MGGRYVGNLREAWGAFGGVFGNLELHTPVERPSLKNSIMHSPKTTAKDPMSYKCHLLRKLRPCYLP